ncbi:hypothetical protein H8E65_00985 [Candidatus Bathyarchaeota archaeon]|nr:hypothetical protein [Candidatus Bathyarchaeota archaeon]MBL7079277.1 hypothetical protein [Candidatus Bathyarchaeota archaeon]
MVDQTNSGVIADYLDIRALDQLFEVDLKPLKNANARILYKIFLNSKKSKHLTTLDIQDLLKSTDLTLHKKEINAWLSSLQVAGLITKEHERGKPTTIDYVGRYTYDLWSLTEKGRDVAKVIEILSSKKTSLNHPENIVNGADFEETEIISGADSDEYTDQVTIQLLRAVLDSKDTVTLNELRERMSPSPEVLIELMSQGTLNGLLKAKPVEPTSFRDKIFGYLGIHKRQKYRLEVTDKGRQILVGVT